MSFINEILSYRTLVYAIAGATGGVISLAICYPLETARTQIQVDNDGQKKKTFPLLKKIVREEGIFAVYRGFCSTMLTLWSSYLIYFYVFNTLKNIVPTDKQNWFSLKYLLFGYLAAVVNVLITTPFWSASTRLRMQGVKLDSPKFKYNKQKQLYTGILDVIHDVIKRDGFLNLWNGSLASFVLASNPAIQCLFYETPKRYLQHASGKQCGLERKENQTTWKVLLHMIRHKRDIGLFYWFQSPESDYFVDIVYHSFIINFTQQLAAVLTFGQV
ncbi:peroxisomal membrane protein PMP34 isoform X5 [Octopus sinensis]|uniref:Peroxisomal membrane protein PMP34 isoform X5 n=1 Tax=Octopus sinensis TaxID=2607531 RepID=A0A7E6FHH8_9MOLL|nr:peroxisomal membrane protein PMP34 isoform X5 [Octopus sinensis]